MSNKYKNGKIYKIVDNTNDNVYYGSTIETLKNRLKKHQYTKRKYVCSSKSIIDNNNYDIILVEDYPCNSKQELELRERYFIENYECINKAIPGRTNKEYYYDNIDKSKQYYQDNKEYINNRQKIYRENNKEREAKTKKAWAENNKEKFSNYQKQRNEYLMSWGGRLNRDNNSLLKIDVNLFL